MGQQWSPISRGCQMAVLYNHSPGCPLASDQGEQRQGWSVWEQADSQQGGLLSACAHARVHALPRCPLSSYRDLQPRRVLLWKWRVPGTGVCV